MSLVCFWNMLCFRLLFLFLYQFINGILNYCAREEKLAIEKKRHKVRYTEKSKVVCLCLEARILSLRLALCVYRFDTIIWRWFLNLTLWYFTYKGHWQCAATSILANYLLNRMWIVKWKGLTDTQCIRTHQQFPEINTHTLLFDATKHL